VVRPNPNDVSCERTNDCVAAFDEGHVCGPAGVCASLVSEQCPQVARPTGVDPENIVYVGSLLPTSPPFDSTFVPLQNAVQLAIEDFNTVATLPEGGKVGWIGCDSRALVDDALEAARYLVEDIGVPAIVGPAFSDPVIDVAQQLGIPNQTFIISPTASAVVVGEFEDEGLVWRTISSDAYQAAALADRLPLLDPLPSRVLILAKNDAYGNGLLEAMRPQLQEALDTARGPKLPAAAIASLVYDDPATFESTNELLSSYGQLIAQGFRHEADTVVLLGTSEVRELILFYLQTRDGENEMVPADEQIALPRFVVSHGAVPVLESVVEMVNEGFAPELMATLEGTAPVIQDEENFQEYNIRYRIRFSDEDALSASSLGYDSAMMVLFGMLATGKSADSLGGRDIADAMPRLVDPTGTVVPFRDGLNFIINASGALGAGENVDLQGVSGPLDFDLGTGEVRTNVIGWGVLPKKNQPTTPLLTPLRQYVLDEAPATSGTWADIP
jgi:branched-chain amino acid transport system substrate-binding protein